MTDATPIRSAYEAGTNGSIASGSEPPVFLRYVDVALRWRWVIGGILVASIFLGLIATLLMTPQYTAEARIEINREQTSVANVDGLETADAARDLEFYQTQYALLEARTLALRVVRELGLARDDVFYETHGADVYDLTDSDPDAPVTPALREARASVAADILLDNVSIVPIRDSALIDIGYTSADPELSKDIANTWAEEFIAFSMDRRFASTADARQFLETRLEELRGRLEESERDVVNFASENDIIALARSESADGQTSADRTLISTDLEQLNQSLAAAKARRIAAEARARGGSNSGASPEALNSSVISQLRQRRATAVAERNDLLVLFDEEYPAARALEATIADIDREIAQEINRVGLSRSAAYREALNEERALQAQVNRLKGQLDAQQRSSIQYNIFQREADTNRELYQALLQRFKEIGVSGVGVNNIAIVDPAESPDEPSSPNLLLNLFLSLVGGSLIAGLAVFGLDQIDEGIRDPSQASKLLGIPLLGAIPALEDDEAEPLEALRDVKSEFSEAYIATRSTLAFLTDHGVPSSLMVTSSRPAEGKSTTSCALAIALARTSKNVLLIDADMRSPSIAGLFDLGEGEGLSSYLSGHENIDAMLRETEFPNLAVFTAGKPPPSASELLTGKRMELLLEEMGKRFDHIVIDSPPILGLADAPLLARACEGAVIVAEAEGPAVRGIRVAIDRLVEARARVFGVVVTKVRKRSAGYGYGYGYGYQYGESEAD